MFGTVLNTHLAFIRFFKVLDNDIKNIRLEFFAIQRLGKNLLIFSFMESPRGLTLFLAKCSRLTKIKTNGNVLASLLWFWTRFCLKNPSIVPTCPHYPWILPTLMSKAAATKTKVSLSWTAKNCVSLKSIYP